jgi:hypothetical protein
MPKATIECPRCKGRVGLSWRGQTLEDALERHEHLTHGTGAVPRPAPPVLAAEPPPTVVKKRIVRGSPRRGPG